VTADTKTTTTLIWEWPLRIWHWLLVICISGSLATGLSGDIGLMDWHLRFGYCACGLLIFRLLWGFAGGLYSRWRHYLPSPKKMYLHFRGMAEQSPHTAPGVGLVVFMLAVITLQTITGLYTTDDIFIEGPLVRGADEELVSTMSAIHHRVYYLVIGAIVIHLTAHVVYGFKGSRLPLSMFTGRKVVMRDYLPTRSRGWWAIVLASLSAALVYGGFELLA
jgi:cytochrome b